MEICPDPQDYETEEQFLQAEDAYEKSKKDARQNGILEAIRYVAARKASALYPDEELPRLIADEMASIARAYRKTDSDRLRIYQRAYFRKLASQAVEAIG